MPDTAERVKCRCGLPMLLTIGGGRYCENCDQVQLWEKKGRARQKTVYDIRFDMSWLQTMSREYTDNTKKTEVGNPNPDDEQGEETPPEEGVTNDG